MPNASAQKEQTRVAAWRVVFFWSVRALSIKERAHSRMQAVEYRGARFGVCYVAATNNESKRPLWHCTLSAAQQHLQSK